MPISRQGKLYYTEEQLMEARCASALEYARSAGYDLVKKGKYYTFREHDSMVFTENGHWFWNSRGLHGGALEFMTQYEHKDFIESVLYLADERGLAAEQKPVDKNQFKPKPIENAEEKPFELPENTGNLKRLFAYLCKTRHLDGEIIKALVNEGKIYAGGKYSNAVFVSYDKDGIARGAFQRGTLSLAKKAFKMETPNSDKSYAFHIPARKGVREVAIFESAIDAISHATLAKNKGEDYMAVHRISIGGCTDFRAVSRFLSEHPEVTGIISCLDNDQAGRNGVQKIHELFAEKYNVSIEIPQKGKDWNEELCSGFEVQKQSIPEPPPREKTVSWELEL